MAACGFLILFVGFAFFSSASIPASTPEANALESRKSFYFVQCLFAGSILFLTGAIWLIGSWFRNRFFFRKTN